MAVPQMNLDVLKNKCNFSLSNQLDDNDKNGNYDFKQQNFSMNWFLVLFTNN